MPDAGPAWPIALTVPVAWGDMDAFGHVNNTVFLRWFESARIAFLERVGLLELMAEQQVGPILARATVDFRRPVKYPDTVRVEAGARRLGSSSWVLAYRAFSASQDALVGEGDSVLVLYDYARETKVPIAGTLRAALEALLLP